MRTFIGRDGFRFLDEREMRLTSRWFHYSTTEVFAGQFRSPDWLLWRDGRFQEALRAMRVAPARGDRAGVWRDRGVQVVRVQAVDAASLRDLLAYLEATHPEEDRLLVDADLCAARGIALPDVDFLIHDDEVVFTKYEGRPSVIYRDAYFNQPPEPGQDDDRPVFRRYAAAADELLARRETIRFQGQLFGLQVLRQLDPA